MLPIVMIASMASSCSSSVSTPAVLAFFFWSRVAAFFGALVKGLNPFNAVKNVGKTIGKGVKKGAKVVGKGVKKGAQAIGRSAKKTGRAIGRSTKKTGRAIKGLFRRRRCFTPETPIKLLNGKIVPMKDLQLGDILINDSIVDAVMTIRNTEEAYYKLPGNILVTGSHYVKHGHKYIQVMHLPGAKPTSTIDPVVNCLITNDHKIPVGDFTFWDWDDHLVPTLENVDTLINKIRIRKKKYMIIE